MVPSRARQFKSLLERACGQPLLSDELIQAAAELIGRVLQVDVVNVFAYDARAENLVLVARHGLSRSSVGYVTLRLGESVSGIAARDRAPVSVSDTRATLSLVSIPALDRGRNRAMAAVPLVLGTSLVGALNVQTSEVHEFTAREVQELTAIAGMVAPLLHDLWRGDLAARVRGSLVLSRLDGLLSGAFSLQVLGERLAEDSI